jgi:deoxyribodipyrimidine photo-lyase
MAEARRWFRLQSLHQLREALRKLGSDLVLLRGDPADQVVEFASQHGVKAIFASREPGTIEKEQEERLLRQSSGKFDVRWALSNELIPVSQLPFDVKQAPELFTAFRQMVERNLRVAPITPVPAVQPAIQLRDAGELPQAPSAAPKGHILPGGESAALARLQHYTQETRSLRRYKETRNGMLRLDDSSKFSPYLADGSLSARMVYHQVKAFEREYGANESTYWLIFELLWREFFRVMAHKHGANLYRIEGIQRLRLPWSQSQEHFTKWCRGETGIPIIDANMIELLETGYMSNRGRQIVASYLTKALNIDWRWGARWFEHHLVDYDPASNYGNWQYVAGVGNDGREFRVFNPRKQAETYDPKAEYVKHWIPSLRPLEAKLAHEPQRQSRVPYHPLLIDFNQKVEENRRAYESVAKRDEPRRPGAMPRGKPRRHRRR